MKTVGRLCLVVACAVMAVHGQAFKVDLYLVNASLVNPATREVRRGNLLIRDGKIASAPARPPADFKGRTLDLTGEGDGGRRGADSCRH